MMDRNIHARATVNLPSLNSRVHVRGELERLTAEFLARGGQIQVSEPLGNGGQWPVPKSAEPTIASSGAKPAKTKKLDGRIRWTPEREQLLRERFDSGEPFEAIAEALGVSASIIKLKASELGLRRRPAKAGADADDEVRRHRKWTPERIQYLASYYATKDSAELASELGISRKSLYVAAARFGISRRASGEAA